MFRLWMVETSPASEIAFLKDRRFLWLDVSNVGPEDSRACLETIAAVAQAPVRSDIVSRTLTSFCDERSAHNKAILPQIRRENV